MIFHGKNDDQLTQKPHHDHDKHRLSSSNKNPCRLWKFGAWVPDGSKEIWFSSNILFLTFISVSGRMAPQKKTISSNMMNHTIQLPYICLESILSRLLTPYAIFFLCREAPATTTIACCSICAVIQKWLDDDFAIWGIEFTSIIHHWSWRLIRYMRKGIYKIFVRFFNFMLLKPAFSVIQRRIDIYIYLEIT